MVDGRFALFGIVLIGTRYLAASLNLSQPFGLPVGQLYGGLILMALLIIFNIIIVIVAICFGLILWKAANAKRPVHTRDNGVKNSISKDSINAS